MMRCVGENGKPSRQAEGRETGRFRHCFRTLLVRSWRRTAFCFPHARHLSRDAQVCQHRTGAGVGILKDISGWDVPLSDQRRSVAEMVVGVISFSPSQGDDAPTTANDETAPGARVQVPNGCFPNLHHPSPLYTSTSLVYTSTGWPPWKTGNGLIRCCPMCLRWPGRITPR